MDTIAAIATAIGEGGIGIIKISGKEAITAVYNIFKHINGKDLRKLPSHRLYYGKIVNSKQEVIDEVLVSVMKAPNTYTRENVVEINCHGGIQSLSQILDLVISQEGVRLAEAGEFTKRAFLNGRIDLVQAESVIDVIRSQTESALRVSVNQLQGRLSAKIAEIINKLIVIQADIAINVDYPEYDEPNKSKENLDSCLQEVFHDIDELLESSKIGKVIREGLKTAIIGKPNVGKSSLLNFLLGEERAIVTEIPGTTRDTVEEFLNLGGVPLHIIDTAGIREADDPVEKIGVERSRKALSSADLILLVIDSSEHLSEEDRQLIELVPQDRSIIVLNKMDLKSVFSEADLKLYQIPIVALSAIEGRGLKGLEQQIKKMFISGKIDTSNELIVSNVRHIDLLRQAKSNIEQAFAALAGNIPIDIVNIDIESANSCLGKIIGRTVEEDLLEYVFAEFCVGK